MSNTKLTEEDFSDAAYELGCDIATIKTVCAIESNGSGFDKKGRPVILYEGHVFSRETEGVYDRDVPDLSYPKWKKDYYNQNQYDRLERAKELNEEAALKACSWGLFQIMGNNYERCNFDSVFDYVDAISINEYEQLMAFVNFIKTEKPNKTNARIGFMLDNLINKNWKDFAYSYNGPGQVELYGNRLSQYYNRISKTL